MAFDPINLGSAANSGTGDKLRTGGARINAMFQELYNLIAALSLHVHAVATTSIAGFMSAADKNKLDSIEASATVNQADSYLRSRVNHTGAQGTDTITGLDAALAARSLTSHTHDTATTSAAGLMTAADKTKLDGITPGATANASDAQLRDRGTHTGTQPQASVDGLPAALSTRVRSVPGIYGGTAITNEFIVTAAQKAAYDANPPADHATTLYVDLGG